MSPRTKISLAACMLAMPASGPAQTQSKPVMGEMVSPSQVSVDKVTDANANEVICEVQPVIGTRLAARKICATRAEWAERRSQERNNIEKLQRNMPTKGN